MAIVIYTSVSESLGTAFVARFVYAVTLKMLGLVDVKLRKSDILALTKYTYNTD
jgi:hypothetical protein